MAKYSIHCTDNGTLQSRTLWRGGRLTLVFTLLALLAIVVGLAVTIIISTPLRNTLPGYMKESQRNETLQAILRLDSLKSVQTRNDAYVNNLLTVLNTDRVPADSVEVAKRGTVTVTDTLKGASEVERRFMSEMEKREKYHLSIVAPMAAEGLDFHLPSGALFVEGSEHEKLGKLAIERGAGVGVVADGTVVDLHYSPKDGGYVAVVQHPKGFMSRYSGLKNPLVMQGEKVHGSQIIGQVAGKVIGLELYRNGDALIPAEYL